MLTRVAKIITAEHRDLLSCVHRLISVPWSGRPGLHCWVLGHHKMFKFIICASSWPYGHQICVICYRCVSCTWMYQYYWVLIACLQVWPPFQCHGGQNVTIQLWVTRGGTNRNHYTQRLILLLARTYWWMLMAHQKPGQLRKSPRKHPKQRE